MLKVPTSSITAVLILSNSTMHLPDPRKEITITITKTMIKSITPTITMETIKTAYVLTRRVSPSGMTTTLKGQNQSQQVFKQMQMLMIEKYGDFSPDGADHK